MTTILQLFTVRVPPSEWQPEAAERFARHLFSLTGMSALKLVAGENRIEWQVGVPGVVAETLKQAVFAWYPHAHIERAVERAGRAWSAIVTIESAQPFVYSLVDVRNCTGSPLTGLLSCLASLRGGEVAELSLLLSPADKQV